MAGTLSALSALSAISFCSGSVPGGGPPPGLEPAPGYSAWWKSGVGVYSDNGVTPANNGDTVYHWHDNAGNGNTMLQSNASQRPIYQTNSLNGQPGLVFDGIDDFMNCGFADDNPATLVIVGKSLSQGTYPRIAGYGQTRSIFRNSNPVGTTWGFYQSAAPITDLGGVVTDPTLLVIRLETMVSHTPRINGVDGTAFAAQISPTVFGIGNNGRTSAPLECGNVVVYEVLHYPYIIDDTEAADTEAYLIDRFGL